MNYSDNFGMISVTIRLVQEFYMENKEVIQLLKDSFELKRQTKYKHALELLYKALTICPENVEILSQVAELHVLLNNPTSACAIYERLLAQKPDDADILERLVNYYLGVFNYDKVKLVIEKFILAYPSESAYSVYLSAMNTMRCYERVVEIYNEKKLDSYHSEKLNKHYVIALVNLKLYKEALETLQYYSDKYSFDEEVQFYYALALYQLGKENEAYELLYPFTKNSESARTYNLCGEIELGRNKIESAINFFSIAVKLKSNGLYFYNLATAYFLNGQLEEAKNAYLKAISDSPDVDEYRYALAYLYYKQEELTKAKQILSQVLQRNSDFEAARLLQANILYDEDKYFFAEKELKQGNFSDSNEEYLVLLAKIYRALYKNELAAETYEKLLAISPQSMDYRFELARVYFDLQKYEKAARLVVSIIAEKPKYVNSYVLASKIYIKMFDFKNVLKTTNEALALDLNNEDSLYLKALAEIGLQMYDESINTAQKLLNYNPHKSEAYALLGACYMEKAEFDIALKYYEEAILVDSKNVDYFLNAANLLKKLGRNKEALRYLYVARSLKSDNKEIINRLIDIYIEEKDYKQALKLLRQNILSINEPERRKKAVSQFDEVALLYKTTVNPLKFLIWKLFKI